MTNFQCTIEEIEEFEKILSNKFDYVKFSFANLHGITFSKVVSRKFVKSFIEKGIDVYSGRFSWNIEGVTTCVKEITDNWFGNAQLFPIKDTLHILPWYRRDVIDGMKNRLVGEVFCEGKWISPYKDGTFMAACPRTVLRRQLQKLSEMGFTLKSAFEIEFSLLHDKSLEAVSTKESQTLDLHLEDLFFDIIEACSEAGVELSSYMLEDVSSEFEFNLEPLEGVKGAESVMIVKTAIKELCLSKGYLASFMSTAFKDLASNSFHLNLSLWETDVDGNKINAFHNPNTEDKMSDVFKYFLGGLMKHAKALSALYCPTVNCYRRLHKCMSPGRIDWNFDDRFAMCRVKNSSSSTFLENRIPSAACNPYLTVAATLAAGMDGIKNKTLLPKPQKGLFEHHYAKEANIRKRDTENDKYMPYSLEEALEELKKNAVLRDGLGNELIEWFLKSKEDVEVGVLKSHDVDSEHRWELERKLYLRTV